MSDDVKWFEFPFEQKRWKRYTKEEKERDRRRTERRSAKLDEIFPRSELLRRLRGLNPEQLTPKERRKLIIAYLAIGCLRLDTEKKCKKTTE